MPHINFAAWLLDGVDYYTPPAAAGVGDGGDAVCPASASLSAGAGRRTSRVLLVVVVGRRRCGRFRRRDVP